MGGEEYTILNHGMTETVFNGSSNVLGTVGDHSNKINLWLLTSEIQMSDIAQPFNNSKSLEDW